MYYIEYKSKKLEKCRRSMNVATRAWGHDAARQYQYCISILEQIHDISELFHIRFLKFHALSGKRKGQFALKLDRRWRLIIAVRGGTTETIRIQEVSRHYGN